MSDKKSSGFDKLDVTILKTLFKYSQYLTITINKLIKSGSFPDFLKIAVVTPIYKKGNINNLSNYRPISVLTTFSQSIEHCIKIRLLNYLENIDFFSPNQFGFLPQRNTELALLKFNMFFYRSIDNNNFTVAIFIDISKAFDSVNHEILLNKLFACGIRGEPHNLLKSYLNNRRQMVKIKNSFSSLSFLTKGVPQGSTLGPLLFLIYINDLLKLELKGEIICFADDTTLLYSGKNKSVLNDEINADLDKIKHWFYVNNLNINTDKTKYIYFSLISRENPFKLKFHKFDCVSEHICSCREIENVQSIKYLGLHIDSNLKWKTHIKFLSNTLRFYLFKFYHLKKFVNADFLTKLYFAWVHPRIFYGLSVWGGDYVTNIQIIETLQKKFVKIISSPTDHFSFLNFKSTGILPLKQLHFYKNCCIIFKNQNICSKRSTINSRRPNVLYNIPKSNRDLP